MFIEIKIAKKAFFRCLFCTLGNNLKKHSLATREESFDKINDFSYYRTINRVCFLFKSLSTVKVRVRGRVSLEKIICDQYDES